MRPPLSRLIGIPMMFLAVLIYLPLTNHLDTSKPWFAYNIWKMEDNKQTLDPRRRESFSFGFLGRWSLFPRAFPFWHARCANDRFVFQLNFSFIDEDVSINLTINFIRSFFRPIITILYHSFDYYNRLVSLVQCLCLFPFRFIQLNFLLELERISLFLRTCKIFIFVSGIDPRNGIYILQFRRLCTRALAWDEKRVLHGERKSLKCQ